MMARTCKSLAPLHVAGQLATLALLVAMVACGDPPETASEFRTQTQDAVADGGDVALPTDISTTSGMAGTWAMATDWSTCVALGENAVELRTYKILKVQIEQDGLVLRERRTLCALTNTPLLGQISKFPQQLIDNFGQPQVDSIIAGEATGDLYHGGIEVQYFGAKLADPLHDALPTSVADPRVTDTDGDGNPGGTLLVGQMCQIFVANRAISSVHGKLVKPGRIEGGAVHDTVQVVLGGTSAFCEQSFPTYTNNDHHAFVLQKADGMDDNQDGQVSCAEIVAHQGQFVQWQNPDNNRCPPPTSP